MRADDDGSGSLHDLPMPSSFVNPMPTPECGPVELSVYGFHGLGVAK